jgi:endo-beta-N-acetylglucosaminidase D
LLLIGLNSFSQIINTAPYILTVDELKQWTPTGTTASTDLIATVPLASRFTNSGTQFNPALNNNMQIAYLPDGMNNFGNYYGEQSQFNLFNFTHWAYLDKLVWFGGTASQTIQLPSSPWVNAAHKNGVKVFGNVFFSPTAFGGSTTTLTNFLEQDGNGDFIAIPKMIALLQYYNFDGWFINEETATNATTAQLMYAFVRDLTAQAEAIGKEIMWYDSMLLSGNISYQNRLDGSNSVFVQNDQDANTATGFEQRVSSSIFVNFFWGSASFPSLSRTRATTIGRSSYDVFTGVDIWPGRNQGNFETSGNNFMTFLHENATTPYTSLGIFAPNCVFNNSTYTNFNNDPTDYATFYNAENHLFGGDDSNPGIVDATGFKGLSNWIPEASVISTTPFFTNFSTGHGIKKFDLGIEVSSDPWHDMNQQDILPTWQFAFSQNGILSASWDFENALKKGNSLKISGYLPANTPIDLMLFKTKFNASLGSSLDIDLFYRSVTNFPYAKILVVYADEPNQKYELALGSGTDFNGWHYSGISDAIQQREVAMIGLRFNSPINITNYNINIGEIYIRERLLGTAENSIDNSFVTVIYTEPGNTPILFTINWPDVKQIHYKVSDMQGKVVKESTISLNATTNYPFQTNSLETGTYIVKFTDQDNHSEIRKIIIK